MHSLMNQSERAPAVQIRALHRRDSTDALRLDGDVTAVWAALIERFSLHASAVPQNSSINQDE